jgi:hypothetical protein
MKKTSGRLDTGMTRRSWATALAAAPLVAKVASPAQQTAPVPAPAAGTVDQQRKKAIDEVRKASERLAQTELPLSMEPAFSFRAL